MRSWMISGSYFPNCVALFTFGVALENLRRGITFCTQIKKRSAVEGLIEIENPNRVSQKSKKVADIDVNAPKELSRRERWVSQNYFQVFHHFFSLMEDFGQSQLYLKHWTCRLQLHMLSEGCCICSPVSLSHCEHLLGFSQKRGDREAEVKRTLQQAP